MRVHTFLNTGVILCILLICSFNIIKGDDDNNHSESVISSFNSPITDKFPIAAWKAFPLDHIPTERDFKLLKECGINIISETINDTILIPKILDIVADNGFKMLIRSDYTSNTTPLPTIVKRFKGHRGLLGYYVCDEPTETDFQFCIDRDRIIKKIDPDLLRYVNLWASDAKYAKDYSSYLEKYITQVNPQILSVDVYPIRSNNSNDYYIYNDYYTTYENLLDKAKKYNLQWMACCQSTALEGFMWPTEENLRFQTITALAYGADAICWWTYQLPTSNPGYFLESPITDGKRTPIWYSMKNVNKEIQDLRSVFMNADVLGIWHTGEKLPKGTKRLSTPPYPIKAITTEKSGVMISHILNDNREYMVIISHNVNHSQRIRITGKQNISIKRVFPNGKEKKVSLGSVNLPPCGYIILRLK